MGRLVFCRELRTGRAQWRITFKFLLAKLDQAETADWDMSVTLSATSEG